MSGHFCVNSLESLEQNGKDPTVLFISGYDREFIGAKASDINFLPKPFTPTALLDKVHETLRAFTNAPVNDQV